MNGSEIDENHLPILLSASSALTNLQIHEVSTSKVGHIFGLLHQSHDFNLLHPSDGSSLCHALDLFGLSMKFLFRLISVWLTFIFVTTIIVLLITQHIIRLTTLSFDVISIVQWNEVDDCSNQGYECHSRHYLTIVIDDNSS